MKTASNLSGSSAFAPQEQEQTPLDFDPLLPQSPETREDQARKLQKLGFSLGWKLPFFMPIFSHLRFVVNESIETAGITLDGYVYFNTNLVLEYSDSTLKGLLAHEMLHLLLNHHVRLDDRDMHKWNIATDFTINQAIRASRLSGDLELPRWVYFPPTQFEREHAEELYRLLDNGTISMPTPTQFVLVGAGCGTLPAQDRNSNSSPLTDSELRRQWSGIASQCRSLGMGKESCKSFLDLTETPVAKVKWEHLVRHACQLARAFHGRDFQSWQKRSRRSSPLGPQFAGWQSSKPNVALVIDSSGSMSNETLLQACAEGASLSRQAANLFLVVHDIEVHFANWLGSNVPAITLAKKIQGRGGTDFVLAYNEVERNGRFDVLVHATDGIVQDWPKKPPNTRQLIVALFNNEPGKISPPAETRVIEVEL